MARTWWDPVVGAAVGTSECPDCGAEAWAACHYSCSSNWDAEEQSLAGEEA